MLALIAPVVFLLVLSAVECDHASAQQEQPTPGRAVPIDLAAALNRLAATLDEEARLAIGAGNTLATDAEVAVQDVPFLAWGITPESLETDLAVSDMPPASEGVLRRQKAVTSAYDKAATFSEYADYLRDFSSDLQGDSAEEAFSRLESAYVPLDVQLLLLQPADPDIREQQQQTPIPPDVLETTAGQGLVPFVWGWGSSATVDFPSVGALLYDRAGEGNVPFCTGTLIAPSIVLTAAHCFCELHPDLNKGGGQHRDAASCRAASYSRGPDRIRALDGTGHSFFLQHVGIIGIEGAVLIPDEYVFPRADLALVFLARRVVSVESARLNGMAATTPIQVGRIVGFGSHSELDENGNATSSAVQNSVGIKVAGNTHIGECEPGRPEAEFICWRYIETIADRLASTCYGDSGGPLFAEIGGEWLLAGVTSFGVGGCVPNARAVDVEVFAYMPWITNVMEEVEAPAEVEPALFPLDPLTNEGRFAAQQSYRRFSDEREEWITAFDLSSTVKVLRVSVNATWGTDSLNLSVLSSDEGQNCELKGGDSSYVCELANPLPGQWRVMIRGSVPREFQMVATVF